MQSSIRVVVLVSSLDRSVPFYSSVLGLTLSTEHESSAYFTEGLVLHESPDGVAQEDLRMNTILISLTIDDVRGTIGRATEHGCPIMVPATDVAEAVTATIADPDGNAIQLVQPVRP